VKKILINLALFQVGWLVCVVGGNLYAIAFTLAALLVHNWLVLGSRAEWKLIASVVVVGCLWDMAMVKTGVISFPKAGLLGIPLWLICLWTLFATTFMHQLAAPIMISLAIMGVGWALLFPFGIYFAGRLRS
jgi:hypothetical protein